AAVEQAQHLVEVIKSPPHKFFARSPDQRPHLRGARVVLTTLDQYQPALPLIGGDFELLLRGRQPVRVLPAILIAEDSDIDRTPGHLVYVEIIRAAIRWRQVLEKEYAKKLSQQIIA